MVGRSGPDIVKRDEGLVKNLEDFKSDALKLQRENLPENFWRAGASELEGYLEKCKENGNRLLEELDKPLKFKKYLVALNDEYKAKETQIDEEMMSAFAEHQKTYFYGLGIKMKALREAGDAAAADLIQAEMDSVADSPEYFSGLMVDANKD